MKEIDKKLPFNFELNIDYSEENYLNVRVILRSNLFEVLEYLSTKFEIGVFTAGEQKYADAILNQIDPLGEFFSFRLYR